MRSTGSESVNDHIVEDIINDHFVEDIVDDFLEDVREDFTKLLVWCKDLSLNKQVSK